VGCQLRWLWSSTAENANGLLDEAQIRGIANIKQDIERASLRATDAFMPFVVKCDVSAVAVSATLNQGMEPVPQVRSQVLRFRRAQYIFRGEIFLFYCIFKTNYFINFQRITLQQIASCLFSVWSHTICDCTGMLHAVGIQAGEEDSSAFLKFSKTITYFSFSNFQKRLLFPEKSIHVKLRTFV